MAEGLQGLWFRRLEVLRSRMHHHQHKSVDVAVPCSRTFKHYLTVVTK
jgi:hypothetical protein